jgi:hypothetical protein
LDARPISWSFSVDASDAVLVAAVVHEREMLEWHLQR